MIHGHTQRQTHTDSAWRHRPRLCIASRGKNGDFRQTSRFFSENMKPYSSFWIVPALMTLSDPWPIFQGHHIIQRQITRKWHNIEQFTMANNCHCLEKGHYSRRMATYCGHSSAPAEYPLKRRKKTTRKLYIIYRNPPFSMTMKNP